MNLFGFIAQNIFPRVEETSLFCCNA